MSRIQLPWMRDVKVGDVLVSGTGTPRVVRQVTRFKDNGDLASVCFAIKACSWTGRPFTTVNYTDLRYRGFRPTGVTYSLSTRADRRLARELENHDLRGMTCCEAKDLP